MRMFVGPPRGPGHRVREEEWYGAIGLRCLLLHQGILRVWQLARRQHAKRWSINGCETAKGSRDRVHVVCTWQELDDTATHEPLPR